MSVLKHLPRFRQARAALSQLRERENWSRAEIDAWQLRRLNEIWQHARSHSSYYEQTASQNGVPEQFESLEQYCSTMPLLEKSVVRQQCESILAKRTDDGCWHRTGGSTGTPMRVFWESSAHRETLRTKYRMLQQWDIEIFDRSAFLWGHSGSVAPGLAGIKQRVRRPIEDRLRNRLRLSAYRLGTNDLDEHLKRLSRFCPHSLYGYSSAVALLAARATEQAVTLPSLKLAILTAEPADHASQQAVNEAFDCKVAIEYGSVECGIIATSDLEGHLRVREDNVFVETIKQDDGRYELVITVLNNPSFPLLRYRIGDVTSAPLAKGDDGFSTLAEIGGRCNDFLVARDGRLVHSLAVKHVLEHHNPIRRFCANQDATGRLRVTLEVESPASEGPSSSVLPLESIGQKLTTMLDGYPVEVTTSDRIAGNLAGKHRWVTSELIDTRT